MPLFKFLPGVEFLKGVSIQPFYQRTGSSKQLSSGNANA
jgi:hypothetical protein